MSQAERHGKPWSDEEIRQLLNGVQKKKTTPEIAEEHKRTIGGIHSKLRQLAADYYFNDNRPIDQIVKFTGLDVETITDAISRRQYQMDMQEKKKESLIKMVETKKLSPQTSMNNYVQNEPKKEGMVSLLTEIRDMMKEMLEIMKKNNST